MKLGDFHLWDETKERGNLDQQIQSFNRTRTEYPRDKTVHAVFAEQAAKTPDAVAVIHGETSITYRELDERSNRLARFLIDWKMKPEAYVGVMLDRSIDMAVCLLGILKAGCAYLPINSDLPFSRIQYLLRDTRARVLLSEKRHIRALNKIQWECPALEIIFALDSMNIHAEQEPLGEMMKEEMWDFIRRDTFDDISGGGWRSSYTGEWLSRAVMDEYGDNIRRKLTPELNPASRVLEIGCASGISMFRLLPRVGFYCGTELSGNILRWTEQEMRERGLNNIRLIQLAAHEIDRLDENHFDVVILNSVVQCFSGHNYFRDVLRKCLDRMSDAGLIFLGNIWDQELLDDFVRSLETFAKENAGKGYTTKIDRSEELFLSRSFFEDLRHDIPEIAAIEYSKMLGKEKSELSEYGYDVILRIDKKKRDRRAPLPTRRKYQFDLRALNKHSIAPVEEHCGPDHLAYLIYTSGTSGTPKGVMVEHRSILRLVLNTNYVSLEPSDRILQTGSLAFDASTFEIWGALLNGGAVCFPQEEDLINADELGRLIRQHGITTIFLTTSLFNMLVEENIGLFSGLKTLFSGGEKVSVRHFNLVRKLYPDLRLNHVYGPTENTTFTTCFRVEKTYERDIPIGCPIANTTVYILDKNFKAAPIGVPGELCTGGEGLARGYLNDPALTAEKFVPHPYEAGERVYRTGDLVRWLPDGNIEFLGRLDNQVKVRGYRIEPSEIENRILRHESVKETIVVAKHFGDNSVDLAAYVTGDDGLDVNQLRDYLKNQLPDYMIPAYIMKVDQWPLNANGKVDRKALPDPRITDLSFSAGRVPPEMETEKQLVSIWEEALECRGIGVTDNFFDSGGHSLKVAKVVSLIEKRMGITVPLTVIFKAPTIRKLAGYILDHARFGWAGIDEAVVHLNGASEGPNLFAFPPGTGDAAGFIQIAEQLKPYSFYGFNFIEAESRLRDYADLVLGIDPVGPYVFLGYSSGGNLAYHIAAELEKRGRRVSDIIMIDSGRKLERIRFAEDEVKKIADDFLNHDSNRPYLASAVLRDKAYRLIKNSYAYFENAVDHHKLKANIHVLVSENSPDAHRDAMGRILSDKRGWRELTNGAFQWVQGYGDHNRMLHQPFVEKNAVVLLEILSRIYAANSVERKSCLS